MLTLENEKDVQSHPKLGASWEGFVIEQIASLAGSSEFYFWATHGGAELDLFLLQRGKRIGIEIKYSDAPRPTRSMRIAMSDLGLDILYIIYPGPVSYVLEDGIEVLSILEIERLFA
jgi:predicted AAA+ superfamily ATPase